MATKLGDLKMSRQNSLLLVVEIGVNPGSGSRRFVTLNRQFYGSREFITSVWYSGVDRQLISEAETE